jgi:hypothetical protein
MRRPGRAASAGGRTGAIWIGAHIADQPCAQQSAIPVIGFLHSASDTLPDRLHGFRQGLKDTGYAEGENVAAV